MIEFSIKENSTTRSFGGHTLNTAIYLYRLLNKNDFSIHYVTALGNDIFSQEIRSSWKKENINKLLNLLSD